MADMRGSALSLRCAVRILTTRCCAGCILPESPACSMFPSGRYCRPPRRQSLKPGPSGTRFFIAIRRVVRSTEARDVIGEVQNLLVVDGCQDFGHGGIVTAANIVFVFAQRLHEVILTLAGDARNIIASRQIQTVTTVATVLRDQGGRLLHARDIPGFGRL